MRDYRQFFTPLDLGMKLLDEISIQKNFNVIDICCGSSNLLKSAYKKNKSIKMYGVDLNLDYIDNTLDCNYYEDDGRKFAIKAFQDNWLFELVLANPPFELGKENSLFSELCACNSAYNALTSTNLLVEMILANLLLVKKNGHLLLIVPSSIIRAEKFKKFRKMLGSNYLVKKIWDIPSKIFQGKEVYTSAILIQNTNLANNSHCAFEKINIKDDELIVSYTECIDYNFIRSGHWIEINKSITKPFPNAKVVRGNISTNMFSNQGISVLHISKKEDQMPWKPKVEKFNFELGKTYHMVNDGDLLMSRIGRDAGRLFKYNGNGDYVSDCIFIIKGVDYKKLVFYLRKYYQSEDLGFLKKGTTSKYISKNDILELLTK